MFFDSNMPPFGDSCYPPPAYEGYEPPKGKKDFAPDASDLTIPRPLLEEARAAKSALAGLTTEEKKAVLRTMADCLLADTQAILAANSVDLEAAQDTIAPVMQDRLRLTEGRIQDMAKGLPAAIRVLAETTPPVIKLH